MTLSNANTGLAWVAFSHQTAYMGTVGGVGRGGGCWREGGTDDVFIGGWVALVRECGLNKEVLMVVRVAWVVLMLLEGLWHVLVVVGEGGWTGGGEPGQSIN